MVRFAAAALALAAALPSLATYGATPEIVLLDFWSPQCGPCMQMKPTVESLIQARYPIRQVNVTQETALSQQFGVTGIPCFVMLVDGREVDRVVGATTSERLQQMFARAKEVVEEQRQLKYQSPDQSPAPATPAVQNSSEAPLPQQLNDKLLSSSVRLTVEEAQARSHGTGTIIDAREGEALIITCGHLFRESKGKSPLKVEMYEVGAQGVRVVETLQGHVVKYDLDRDVAFVSIRTTRPVNVAPVAPQRTQITKGDLAASVGCSNGKDPTVLSTRVTWLDRYQGPPNIEASGAPVEGRSGGGLFNEQGQLVGVCFAADYEGNRGLYAGLESIHDELKLLGLEEIYAKPPAALAGGPNNPFGQKTEEPVVRAQEMPDTLSQTAGGAAPQPSASVTIGPQSSTGPLPQGLSPTEQAALEEILKRAAKRNVVCIVQPETPGKELEVITLESVSDEFVRALAERQQPSPTITR